MANNIYIITEARNPPYMQVYVCGYSIVLLTLLTVVAPDRPHIGYVYARTGIWPGALIALPTRLYYSHLALATTHLNILYSCCEVAAKSQLNHFDICGSNLMTSDFETNVPVAFMQPLIGGGPV